MKWIKKQRRREKEKIKVKEISIDVLYHHFVPIFVFSQIFWHFWQCLTNWMISRENSENKSRESERRRSETGNWKTNCKVCKRKDKRCERRWFEKNDNNKIESKSNESVILHIFSHFCVWLKIKIFLLNRWKKLRWKSEDEGKEECDAATTNVHS